MYAVKEIFYTLQGEGANAGRPAVFCRFTGCNLWSGREQDRSRGAGNCARWCDTDFVGTDGVGGGRFAGARSLAASVRAAWVGPWEGRPLVVCTGGEPLLQIDASLMDELHRAGFEIAVETNGTLPVPDGVDWVCVSPKAGTELAQRHGNELKIIFPQVGLMPEDLGDVSGFGHLFLQPMDGPNQIKNTSLAVAYCLAHPRWRLSIQSHKMIGVR